MRILGLDIKWAERPTPATLLAEANARQARSVALSEQGWNTISDATAAGMRLNEEGAMRLMAVYASVRVIAESIASLPFKLYRRSGRSKSPAPEHPLYRVLHDQANAIMSAMDYRELQLVHLLLWGNHYAEIERDGRGAIIALWPIHPARVNVRHRRRSGRILPVYNVGRSDGTSGEVDAQKILHIRGLGFDGVEGKSPIRLHREALGVDAAAQRFGARFFAADARSGVILSTENTLTDESYNRIRKEWKEEAGPGKAWSTKILDGGLKADTLSMPMSDAQFIETRKFSRTEIAGIYRVPPHKIGDLEHATFSNIEHQAIEFVVDTLRPWLVRIEQATAMSLLDPEERSGYFVSHVVDGLLRGDIKTRYEAYSIARNWGWMNADDVRELEDTNPLPDGKGEIYLQPLNMVEAGTDPLAAGNDDVSFDEPGASGIGARSRRALERRALPTRYGTAKALETVYRDQLRRIVKREIVEIKKLLQDLRDGNPDLFGTKLVRFESEHAEWMESRVLPMYRSMAEAMVAAAADELGDDELTIEQLETFVGDYARTYTRRYTGSSRGRLLSLTQNAEEDVDLLGIVEAQLDEWEENRANQEARRERQRSSNAFTKAAWAVAGVATLTWQTVGKSCPICEEMDGRTSAMGGSFLEGGDSVADLQVSSSITHPPLHDGCDCILIPGVGARKRLEPAELRSIFEELIGAAPEHEHIHSNGQSHG